MTTVIAAAAMITLPGYADIITDVPSAVSIESSVSVQNSDNISHTEIVQRPEPGQTAQTAGNSSSRNHTVQATEQSQTVQVMGQSVNQSQSTPTAGSRPVQTVQKSGEMLSINVGGDTVIVDVPGSLPDLPESKQLSPGNTLGRTSSIFAPQQSETAVIEGVPGLKYADAAKTRLELGFTLVSPNTEYNGFKVAEGCVQLSDGSWDYIGYDQYIRQPYYRLLREDGDWYVVAVKAKKIGNYSVKDGSTVSELWLRKSDCTARSYIELNTNNELRRQIVSTALSMLGKGYRYGGNGPEEYDCSGFVNKMMSTAGIKVARTSTELCGAGRDVGISGLRPGDIVGRTGHVGIYIGDGLFIHAAEASSGVITDSLEIYNRYSAFNSYRNVVGD